MPVARLSSNVCLRPLWIVLVLCAMLAAASEGWSQHVGHGDAAPHEHHGPAGGPGSGWEGSPAAKAYSEFNHHLAGVFVLFIGATELLQVRPGLLPVSAAATMTVGRAALPAFMLATGVFLMIWSDHDAWPIGPLSLRETFSGQDLEMLQHKLFGILLLLVGLVEALRRTGRLDHPAWRVPLPVFAIAGGLSLFLHSHGAHPEAHKIAVHHALMGAMAVTAGSTKLAAQWRRAAGSDRSSRWDLLWPVLVVLIGVQLLLYAE